MEPSSQLMNHHNIQKIVIKGLRLVALIIPSSFHILLRCNFGRKTSRDKIKSYRNCYKSKDNNTSKHLKVMSNLKISTNVTIQTMFLL